MQSQGQQTIPRGKLFTPTRKGKDIQSLEHETTTTQRLKRFKYKYQIKNELQMQSFKSLKNKVQVSSVYVLPFQDGLRLNKTDVRRTPMSSLKMTVYLTT